MTVEYRVLTPEDIEQSVHVEAVAFYGKVTPERVELQRQYLPPDWTVGAFVDGRLVADVRTIPFNRRINGAAVGFGGVGPVACLAQYRRQGHVGALLKLALERMRERGQPLSGLHTPHDALYARYGWERAEGKKRLEFAPKDITFRLQGAPGRLDHATPDDWARLDAVFRAWAEPRNGPLARVEPWWRLSVLQEFGDTGSKDREAYVWVSPEGHDEGYVVYVNHAMAPEGGWTPQRIWVRDLVSLSGDAYLGLWQHMLTHDLARRISIETSPDDPFRELVEDPFKVDATFSEGAMIGIVDVEQAIGRRPYCGNGHASFTMRIADRAAPWNEDTWRVEAAEGRMTAERVKGDPDLELTANTLAPLYTGHMRPDVAAGVGLLKVNRPEAVSEMVEAFAVTYPPFCNDFY